MVCSFRQIALGSAAALWLGLAAGPVQAQAWPSRWITLVVPFAPGGNVDAPARLFARELAMKLGHDVVVENKTGAGGGIASTFVAKARPDGYTLLLTASGPAVFNKLLYKTLSYDPDADFTPIIITNDVPQALVVGPQSPIGSVADLVAAAKARRGAFTLAHAGPGTTGHLACVLFIAHTGIEVQLVSYRGGAPMITDLLGGHIDAGFPAYIPQVATVKAIAITSDVRMSFLPQVPTIRESGISDLTATTWNALMGPAGLPSDIVERLNGILNRYLATDTAKAELAAMGGRVLGGSPQDVVRIMAEERSKWAPIIKAANIVLEP